MSQHVRHLAALRTTFEAENWSGRARVQSALDGGVVNAGVRADADLASQHLQTVRADEISDDTVLLETITSQSRITLALAARTQVFCDGQPVTVDRHSYDTDADEVGHEFSVNLAPGMPVTVEKVVAPAPPHAIQRSPRQLWRSSLGRARPARSPTCSPITPGPGRRSGGSSV